MNCRLINKAERKVLRREMGEKKRGRHGERERDLMSGGRSRTVGVLSFNAK